MNRFLDAILARVLGSNEDLNSVLRGAGSVFPIQVFGLALAYLTQLLLARWLGVEGFGVYSYALAWSTLLAVPVSLGLPTAVIRFVSANVGTLQWSLAAGAIRWSRAVVTAAGITLAIILLAVATAAAEFIGDEYVEPLRVACLVIPFAALLQVQSGIARGLHMPVVAYLPDLMARPFVLLAILAAAAMSNYVITSSLALICTLISFVIACAIQYIFIERRVPPELRSAKVEYSSREWIAVAMPLVLLAGARIVINRTDVIMLGTLVGADDVAIFSAASKTSALITIILTAVTALTAPKIASLYSQNKLQELRKLVRGVLHWIFWPTLFFVALLLVLGNMILSLFGPEFTTGYSVLIILAFGQLINASAGPVLVLLNMTGHQSESARVFGYTALANIVLNSVLIPAFGMHGAAVATSATMALWNLWLVWTVKQRLGINSLVFAPRVHESG